MRLRFSSQGLTGVAIASLTIFTTSATINQPSYAGGTTFFCAKSKGIPITFARTQDGRKVPMIKWISQDYFSRDWPVERRCQEVSRRFQRSYDNGTLKYIRTGTLRGEPVVCAANSYNAACTDNNLLFTLKRGSSAKDTVRRLLNRRGLVAGNVLNESGGGDTLNVEFDRYINNATEEPSSDSIQD
ncbi:COP23 domain-containing protein [Dendronalium sp. ChiSLP03b]|uniref:COP23 domain-containing protein n=1 Tax=Dendronalium sp. ChiSLP03b TaxID=3075381 RepID=UPI002AD4AE28|nr:COP23 domain-containing protein [Dendronalium sp. ChiSLP03b]MDZ8205738.1 COP23 domain-containing protein [Dendronalium sp. ChiSLP03b]